MQIFLPYTEIQPITRMAMRHYSYTAVRLDGDDAYSEYLGQRWAAGEDFINVEHDVAPWLGSIEELEECPEPWCAFLSDSALWAPTLCLARFRRELLLEHPVDWALQRSAIDDHWHASGKKTWQYCDAWMRGQLEVRGVFAHRHGPPVLNANATLLEGYRLPFFEFNPGDDPRVSSHIAETWYREAASCESANSLWGLS